ncbi:MAG: right-handed parallel beta-helix repeat-containing protein, partial [candidate division WOR-3 bacterium]
FDVYQNGNQSEKYPQIWVEGSSLTIKNSRVHDSVNGNGITSKGSEIKGESCEVFKNYYYGLRFIKNSTVVLSNFDVYQNGNQSGNYPQIWVEGSSLTIKNSKVHDSVNAGGIYSKGSKIEGEGCEVFKNYYHGLFLGNSTVVLSNFDVYQNGNQSEDYSQIWLEDSFVYISDSQIYNARKGSGIYCKGSLTELVIKRVRTYGNSVGLRCMGYKKLEIDNSSYFYDGIK